MLDSLLFIGLSFVVLFLVVLFIRLLVPSTEGIRAGSSAHAETVLHDPEYHEEKNADNNIDRLFGHSVFILLYQQDRSL